MVYTNPPAIGKLTWTGKTGVGVFLDGGQTLVYGRSQTQNRKVQESPPGTWTPQEWKEEVEVPGCS